MILQTEMNNLHGFGPIYVINLPRRTDRREHMEHLFKHYDITNYTFIDAFDGKDDLTNYIDSKSSYSKSVRKEEIATTMSHIKAIKHWLDSSDTEYAIFCEDDLSFDTVEHWGWTWQDFLNAIDFEYSVIQLCVTQFVKFQPKLHKRDRNDFSEGIYILNRHHATAIIERMMRKDKYFLDGKRQNSVADHDVIFGHTNKAFSCSLFTYEIKMPSDLNPQGQALHKKCRQDAIEFWQKQKIKLSDFVKVS